MWHSLFTYLFVLLSLGCVQDLGYPELTRNSTCSQEWGRTFHFGFSFLHLLVLGSQTRTTILGLYDAREPTPGLHSASHFTSWDPLPAIKRVPSKAEAPMKWNRGKLSDKKKICWEVLSYSGNAKSLRWAIQCSPLTSIGGSCIRHDLRTPIGKKL